MPKEVEHNGFGMHHGDGFGPKMAEMQKRALRHASPERVGQHLAKLGGNVNRIHSGGSTPQGRAKNSAIAKMSKKGGAAGVKSGWAEWHAKHGG